MQNQQLNSNGKTQGHAELIFGPWTNNVAKY